MIIALAINLACKAFEIAILFCIEMSNYKTSNHIVKSIQNSFSICKILSNTHRPCATTLKDYYKLKCVKHVERHSCTYCSHIKV